MRFQFSRRERVIFCVLLILLGGYAVYEAGYRSFWLNLQSLRRRVDVEKRTLSHQRAVLAERLSQARLRKPILDTYRQKESDGAVRSKTLAALQKLALSRDVRITNMKPVAIRQEEVSYREFPVNVMLEGNFVNIMHFLFDAESRHYGFYIKTFRFSQPRTSKGTLGCQIVLSRIFLNSEG